MSRQVQKVIDAAVVAGLVFLLPLVSDVAAALAAKHEGQNAAGPAAARLMPHNRDEFLEWACPAGAGGDRSGCDETNISARTASVFESLMKNLAKQYPELVRKSAARYRDGTPRGESNLPYWRFVPKFIGKIRPGESLATFETLCYGAVNVNVESGLVGDMYVRINVQLNNQTTEPTCTERFWFSLGRLSETTIYHFADQYKVFFNASEFDDFQRWDLATHGIRVYVFADTEWQHISDIWDTALLFAPKLTGVVDPVSMQDNMVYLNQFSLIKPFATLRGNSTMLEVDESLIGNGDLLFQSDMDGLGPTIAFPTGSTANHVAIFLRDPIFGDLNVCEATTPEITCTEYPTWLKKQHSRKAATVWMPLAPEFSASFNNAAAWDWVWSQVGLSYGFNTFFFGWIDTKEDNYPCFPPDFTRCLAWEHVEWFLLNVDAFSPQLSSTFVGQAFNLRLNTTNLTMPQLLHYAETVLNISASSIITIPEQDSWLYQTSKDGFPYTGKSMVCSVFSCHVLRQGGVFANINGNLECGEQTPFDMSSMKIFDEAKLGANRPAPCVEQDPSNHLCQLTGPFTFHLNDGRNSRTPYPQMSNECPSRNPLYNRTSDC